MTNGIVFTPSLPDPRSGFVLDTHDLSLGAGDVLEVSRVVEAPADLGLDMIGVPLGSPIALNLQLSSVGEGVLVTGTAEVLLKGNCTRCLEEISSTELIDVQELFCYPGKELDDEEASRIEGTLIDLEPILRDCVVLDLPFTPLCRQDCAGLCPTCGVDLNVNPDHRHTEAIDARWSSLAQWAQTEDETKN